jgi:penicillin amidase
MNRGPMTTSGGGSIVNATGWTPSQGYAVAWIPSMRRVLDVANLDNSTWANLTGASGHAVNAHDVDQLDAWQNGTTYPFAFTASAVQAAAKDHLVLKPGCSAGRSSAHDAARPLDAQIGTERR